MSTSEKSSPPPVENVTPHGSGFSPDTWVMKGLNDLREDVKGIRDSISGVDKRLASLEKTVMRALYGFGGVAATIFMFWAVFQVAIRYVDIEIKAKQEAIQSE